LLALKNLIHLQRPDPDFVEIKILKPKVIIELVNLTRFYFVLESN